MNNHLNFSPSSELKHNASFTEKGFVQGFITLLPTCMKLIPIVLKESADESIVSKTHVIRAETS